MADGQVVGLVLAGGAARRMGGGDKPLLPLGGRPILARVLERLAPQVDDLILSANGDPARFAAFGLPVVADAVAGQAGPLAGLLAGLDWVAAHRPNIGALISVAGDAPFLPHDLVARLVAARAERGVAIACAASNGRVHPVNALWAVDLRHALRRALLQEGLRKVGLFAEREGAVRVAWDTEPVDPFVNVNTPADLAEAERSLAMNPDC